MIRDWLVDLDNCLYPYDNGLYHHINEKMNDYISINLNVAQNKVNQIRKSFIRTYGSTLLGLILHHQIDANDFLNCTHDIPLDQYIVEDLYLTNFIKEHLQGKLFIFTNAPGFYASKVIRLLGIEEWVEEVFDIYFTAFEGKPYEKAFRKVIHHTGILPHETLFIDDMKNNILTARKLGFPTIHIDTSIPFENNYYNDLFIPMVKQKLKVSEVI